jgi:hypothetical protein
MTFARSRGCGLGRVTADGGTFNSRAFAGFFIQGGFFHPGRCNPV